MIITTTVWLCLITHVIYGAMSTVITVDNTCPGRRCKGNPSCTSSLSCTLTNLKNNTVINITSEVVTLSDIVGMGSGNLNNITITGNGATIMCDNTGGVYCESCSNVIIRGITWHQCGCSHPPLAPALNFTIVSYMSIHNCFFIKSSGCPVFLYYGRESITITDTYFVDNNFYATPYQVLLNDYCGGLYINLDQNYTNISIISSGFYGTDCIMSDASYPCSFYGIVVNAETNGVVAINIFIASTEISNNSRGLYLVNTVAKTVTVQLSNVTVYNNSAYGIVIKNLAFGNGTSCRISISFVSFMRNVNALNIASGPIENFEIAMNNSIITGNTGEDADTFFSEGVWIGVIRIAIASNTSSVIIANSQFYSNFNGAIGIRALPFNNFMAGSALTLFTNVTIYNTTAIMYAGIASVSITYSGIKCSNTTFTNVNFTSNNYSKYNGEVLYIENNVNNMGYIPVYYDIFIYTSLIDCVFYCNSASDHVVFLNTIEKTNDNYSVYYRIAGKFGMEFNLAVWWITEKPPN